MIGRAHAFSTSTACEFIATSSTPTATPNAKSAHARAHPLSATAGNGNARHSNRTPARVSGRVPVRTESHAVAGMAKRLPSVLPRSARPSAPVLRPMLP